MGKALSRCIMEAGALVREQKAGFYSRTGYVGTLGGVWGGGGTSVNSSFQWGFM